MKNKAFNAGNISIELSHVDKIFWPEEHIIGGIDRK
jgi:hypothetical protein